MYSFSRVKNRPILQTFFATSTTLWERLFRK